MPEGAQKPIKVFISYSWTTPQHEDWVMDLAQRLVESGIEVVIDKWDLRTGQDTYHFMEKSVKDPETTHVLMILDKGYTDKANSRTSGAGTEAQILSPEIYRDVEATKFIPIVREIDEHKKPYRPVFLTTRLYIDFSDDDKFDESFTKLMNDLLNKPTHRKPELGTIPAHFLDDTPTLNRKTNQLVRGLDSILNKHPERINTTLREFLDEFVTRLGDFKYTIAEEDNTPEKLPKAVGKVLIQQLDTYTPLREDLLLFFSKLAQNGLDFNIDLLINFLSKLYHYTEISGQNRRVYDAEFEFYKFLIHELFLNLIGLFLHHGQYAPVEQLLHSQYRVKLPYTEKSHQPYTIFYFSVQSIDYYYTEEWRRKNHNVQGDLIYPQATLLLERCSVLVPVPYLIEADLICYHIAELNEINSHQLGGNWYPLLHIYQPKSELDFFQGIISRRFFEKVKGVYGVNSPSELANKIQEYKTLRSGSSGGYGRSGRIFPIDRLVDLQTIAAYK